MKSLEFSKYGSPDDLRLIEANIPEPEDNEVLVRIHASSINSWDWELLRGTPFANKVMFGLFRPKKLKTLGIDVAGIVEKTGASVPGFKPGDAVYGDLSACGMGAFAEYVAVPGNALAPKPGNISFEQAAAIPQAGLLALQGLVDAGHIKSGQNVLINGASGGSGSIAVQIAKDCGAEVTGVCRTGKMDFVRSLGADHVIDYMNEDFTRGREKYDLVIDAQDHHSLFENRRALKPGGVYVAHGGSSSCMTQLILLGPLVSVMGNRKLKILFHKANRGLDRMSALLANGKVVPSIDRVYPLDDIVEALRYYGAGKTRGKVVIRMH